MKDINYKDCIKDIESRKIICPSCLTDIENEFFGNGMFVYGEIFLKDGNSRKPTEEELQNWHARSKIKYLITSLCRENMDTIKTLEEKCNELGLEIIIKKK